MHPSDPVVADAPARSIDRPPPVPIERLNGAEPVLTPRAGGPWENRVVLNPAGQLVGPDDLERLLPAWELAPSQADRLRRAGGACVLLYRAQGDVDPALRVAPSSLGWAVFTPRMEPVARWDRPAIRPDQPYHNLGVEDARCTLVGGTYYLYYTGYRDPSPEDDFDRSVDICLATSEDLANWTCHGPAAGELNAVNNKNAALFEGTVGGKHLLLHRPMEGPNAMAVHLAHADSPAGPWTSRGMLFASYRYREFAQSWVGAGGPPLPLGGDRFLMVYHQGHYAPDGGREYDLSAALLDFSLSEPVVSRIEPLMRPTSAAEMQGDEQLGVDNVLFTCANHRWGDDLVVPYAGADSRIFGAAVPFEGLVDALERAA